MIVFTDNTWDMGRVQMGGGAYTPRRAGWMMRTGEESRGGRRVGKMEGGTNRADKAMDLVPESDDDGRLTIDLKGGQTRRDGAASSCGRQSRRAGQTPGGRAGRGEAGPGRVREIRGSAMRWNDPRGSSPTRTGRSCSRYDWPQDWSRALCVPSPRTPVRA